MMHEGKRKTDTVCLAAAVILICFLAQTIDCYRLKKSERREGRKGADTAKLRSFQEGKIVFGRVFQKESGSESLVVDGTEKSSSNTSVEDEAAYQADYAGLPALQAADSKLWTGMSPSLRCSGDQLKFSAFGPEASHFAIQQPGKSHSIPLSQVPASCGYSMQRNPLALIMIISYNGCNMLQEGGGYMLPMRWRGAPVSLWCPKPAAPAPTTAVPLDQLAHLHQWAQLHQLPQMPQLPQVHPVPQMPQLPQVHPVPQMPQLPHVHPVPQMPQLPHVHPVPQMPQLPHVHPVPQMPQLPHVHPVPQMPQLPHVHPVPQMLQLPHVHPVPQMSQLHQVPHLHQLAHLLQVPHLHQLPQVPPYKDPQISNLKFPPHYFGPFPWFKEPLAPTPEPPTTSQPPAVPTMPYPPFFHPYHPLVHVFPPFFPFPTPQPATAPTPETEKPVPPHYHPHDHHPATLPPYYHH